jgi:hypothetical protein
MNGLKSVTLSFNFTSNFRLIFGFLSQDGTINYLTLPAVTDGLRFLTAYLTFLPLRLSCLMHFLTTTLAQLRHDTTKRPVVKILSRLPDRRLRSVGEQADTGSTVSLLFCGVSVFSLSLSPLYWTDVSFFAFPA